MKDHQVIPSIAAEAAMVLFRVGLPDERTALVVFFHQRSLLPAQTTRIQDGGREVQFGMPYFAQLVSTYKHYLWKYLLPLRAHVGEIDSSIHALGRTRLQKATPRRNHTRASRETGQVSGRSRQLGFVIPHQTPDKVLSPKTANVTVFETLLEELGQPSKCWQDI
jgi:hypothetical protein